MKSTFVILLILFTLLISFLIYLELLNFKSNQQTLSKNLDREKMLFFLLEECKFSLNEIKETEEGFWVRGNIFFEKNNFWKKIDLPKSH